MHLERHQAKFSKIDMKRGSINSGSKLNSNNNSLEASPMKFKDRERLRMKGELAAQKQADMARGRTLDGLLTSPEKQRSFL